MGKTHPDEGDEDGDDVDDNYDGGGGKHRSKGIEIFSERPQSRWITFHTRDLSPYKKALHALHFCIFVPAPASPCVSLWMRLQC